MRRKGWSHVRSFPTHLSFFTVTTHHASPRLPLSLLDLTHSRDKNKHVFPMTDQRHGAKWIMTIMTYLSAPKDCSVSIKIWKSQLTSVHSNMTRADPWSETEQPMIFPKAAVTTGGWTGYAPRHLGTKWVTSLQKEPRKQALYKKSQNVVEKVKCPTVAGMFTTLSSHPLWGTWIWAMTMPCFHGRDWRLAHSLSSLSKTRKVVLFFFF